MNVLFVLSLIALISLSSGAEDSCSYCSDKTRSPVEGKTPTSNGCGTEAVSGWYSKQVSKGAVPCCDAHDICYSTCNKTRVECDQEFEACIAKNQNENSVGWYSKLMENLLVLFVKSPVGCNAYKASQQEFCECK